MDNTKPIYTPLSSSSYGRNIRAGSTLYGIVNIKWMRSSIAHVNHYYIGLVIANLSFLIFDRVLQYLSFLLYGCSTQYYIAHLTHVVTHHVVSV